MTIASQGERSKIELGSDNLLTVHFGMISLLIAIEDLEVVADMFDESGHIVMKNREICAIHKVDEKSFIFCFKGVTMLLCPSALKNFGNLVLAGKSWIASNCQQRMSIDEDITEMLTQIENSVF